MMNEDEFFNIITEIVKGGGIAIKLSTFGAATLVADMRLKSHPLTMYSLNLMVLLGGGYKYVPFHRKPYKTCHTGSFIRKRKINQKVFTP